MKHNLFVLLLLLSLAAHAEDAGQLVLDAMGDTSELESDIKNIEEEDEGLSGFYPGSGANLPQVEDEKVNPFFPNSGATIAEPKARDRILDRGQRVAGDSSIPKDRLIEADDRSLFKEVGRKQKTTFSFYYVRDDFDVEDNRGVFDRTYNDSPGAVRGGTLMLSWERTFLNSWINLAWGGNVGVGLSQGKGVFVDGQQSNTEFSLWTIPVELGITLELPVATWFDLSAEAGPAVVGLYQVRSDFEDGAAGKRRRQVGTGYYAEARFKLSLSNMFRRTAFDLFSEYGVTNATLDVIARMQDYGNFQDDITISGQSLGIGFTFDYL